MSARTEIGIGSEFVGYRLDELIGRGGMGVVYRAFDLRLRRTVALKLMAPELALDQRFRERFSREAELAMSLEHPNVVPIHDAGDIDGRLYLAMRLVEGTDLRALLRAEALDTAQSLAICSQVAKALDAAHAKGLVHRDVKPSNVLLDANEHVYLADFGLTRRLDEQGGPAGEGRSVGTPAYLAPEQIEGRPVDGRTDVYSLGCLLYECLTGEAPFAGSRLAVAWAHLEEDPPSANARRPELPEAIDAVIRKALAKEPDARYPTCGALITAAAQALGLGRPPIVRRHKLLVIAAGAICLLLAAALVAALIVGGSGGGATPPVTAGSLVRIDPATNAVIAVVHVGGSPSAAAVAVGGQSVWVLNAAGPFLTEIDASTNAVLNTTTLFAAPNNPHAAGGPALAADRGGAWLIGADQRGRPYLTRVFSGFRGQREYRLPGKPRAIAVSDGAVWVVVRGALDNQLLRVNPATGRVTNRIRFPNSSPIDGLAAGLGSVWLGASSTLTLFKINPGLARVTGRIDLVGRDTGRPEVVLGRIWFGGDGANETLIFDPRTLDIVGQVGGGSGGSAGGYDTGGYGSIWDYDTPTGTVVRWDGTTHQVASNIRVTAPPTFDGLCLTSLAAGGGAVWVTVNANSTNYSLNNGC